MSQLVVYLFVHQLFFRALKQGDESNVPVIILLDNLNEKKINDPWI